MADARFHDWGIFERREAARHIVARPLRALRARDARLRVWVYTFAVSIASHFQAARLDVGHSVNFVVVEEPGWQRRRLKAWISRRAAEEEDFLAGREDALAQQFRENLA